MSRMLMINAAATTTTGAAPASSIPITAACALPAKISGPVSHPANLGISACAALKPMASPKGTIPASHGVIARAPAARSRRLARRLITASPLRWPARRRDLIGPVHQMCALRRPQTWRKSGEHLETRAALPGRDRPVPARLLTQLDVGGVHELAAGRAGA